MTEFKALADITVAGEPVKAGETVELDDEAAHDPLVRGLVEPAEGKKPKKAKASRSRGGAREV